MEKAAHIQPGEHAFYQGKNVVIRKIISNKDILIQAGNNLITVFRNELFAPPNKEEGVDQEPDSSLLDIPQVAWDEAHRKYQIIKRALDKPGDGEIVKSIAEENGINTATIYRWIDKYAKSGCIEGLVEGRGLKNKGKKKLPKEIEELITTSIKDVFNAKGRRQSIKRVIEDVALKCKKLKLPMPHKNSIRLRVNSSDEKAAEKARRGEKKANEKFSAKTGTFLSGRRAMSFIQMDHTPLDIIIIDSVFGEPIGRPYASLGVDLKTRMNPGYYLTFGAPSTLSIGMCIANMINRKEEYLQALGVEGDWPCWGSPATIGLDNAPEFRSKSLEISCKKYGINLQWRRRGEPRDGAFIEAFNKTVENEIHNLPGTTFSSVKNRDGYESEKMAVMTFPVFEKWFANFIVNNYHHSFHSKLNTSPYAAWEDEIVGSGTTPGIGWQKVQDAERVKIDFLPLEYRTVQDYGISMEGIKYYDNILKSWINRTGRVEGKNKIQHEIRWDPRNLKYIYFYDRETLQYYKIPYGDLTHPEVSIWEWRAIHKHLKAVGVGKIDEEAKFRGLKAQRDLEAQAQSEAARLKLARKNGRKQDSEKPVKPVTKKETDIISNIDIGSIGSFL